MKVITIIKEGDALVGKAFEWVKTEGEHVIVAIETEEGKLFAKFHGNHGKSENDDTPIHKATKAEVNASAAATEVPAPAVPEQTPVGATENSPEPKAETNPAAETSGSVAGAPVDDADKSSATVSGASA